METIARYFDGTLLRDTGELGGDCEEILGIFKMGVLSQELEENGRKFKERLMPGCFSQSIKEGNIPLFFEHRSQLITQSGERFHLFEDGDELLFSARLRSALGSNLLQLAEVGRLALSPRFRAKREDWIIENGEHVRKVVEADLVELSLTEIPAYLQSRVVTPPRPERIAEVKSKILRGDFPGAFVPEPPVFMVP